MACLQGTFANRFNRFHGERGHLFQNRYKSILIEEGRPLLCLVNYIHLNPVRAGIHGVGDLKDLSILEYPKFFEKNSSLYLSRAEVRELRDGKWEMELKKLLRRSRKTHDEVLAAQKSAVWKIKIACELRRQTTATNPWIVIALSMGHFSRIPNLDNEI